MSKMNKESEKTSFLLPGFTRDVWICPVTLCVLGHYPKFIYLRKVDQ